MFKIIFIFGLVCSIFFIVFYYKPKVDVVQPKLEVKKEVVLKDTPKAFNILIVPGHDVDFGGAKFKDYYERDLVVTISEKIESILNKEGIYKVIRTRNAVSWNPVFLDYFKNEEQEIIDFKNQKQLEDKILMSSGDKKFVPDMATHSEVDKKTAVQLYGINKWANENDIDFVVHLHFNDSGRPNADIPGSYKGFSIYTPESQMINSSSSRIFAENIYKELLKILTPEIAGNHNTSIFEDQSLIALGASGTLSKPSILLEFGYIYEKIFRTSEEREKVFDQIAERVVAGIKNVLIL